MKGAYHGFSIDGQCWVIDEEYLKKESEHQKSPNTNTNTMNLDIEQIKGQDRHKQVRENRDDERINYV